MPVDLTCTALGHGRSRHVPKYTDMGRVRRRYADRGPGQELPFLCFSLVDITAKWRYSRTCCTSACCSNNSTNRSYWVWWWRPCDKTCKMHLLCSDPVESVFPQMRGESLCRWSEVLEWSQCPMLFGSIFNKGYVTGRSERMEYHLEGDGENTHLESNRNVNIRAASQFHDKVQ